MDKIVSFIKKYSPYRDEEKIKEYIKLHLDYKTCFVGTDNLGEITFICRWNISQDGKTADILDLYIREDWRNKDLIRQLLERGLWIFPKVEYITFERGVKYPNKNRKVYSVERILKRSRNG